MGTRPVRIICRGQLATVGRYIMELGITCTDSLGAWLKILVKIRPLDLDHSHTFLSVLQYAVTESDQTAREILQNVGQQNAVIRP
jgi:hypothetical protein